MKRELLYRMNYDILCKTVEKWKLQRKSKINIDKTVSSRYNIAKWWLKGDIFLHSRRPHAAIKPISVPENDRNPYLSCIVGRKIMQIYPPALL